MKLEKYVDKDKKRRKVILIGISIIVLISASFLLYKTFASFTESAEFPIMNGKVDYFGNSDVYFAFYKGDEKLDEMPQKDNKDNLVFDHGTCDNGASIIWDGEAWGPMVKNLSKSKTKCSLYFKEKIPSDNAIEFIKKLSKTDNINLSYDGKESLGELGTEDNNLRYVGGNPNNYIRFNNEIWRIIGVMKVETVDGNIEERIKIIRQNEIDDQQDFGFYLWNFKDFELENVNNWNDASLMEILNGIYYNSLDGNCYYDNNFEEKTCNFKSGLLKGINDESRSFIDKKIKWKLGGIAEENMYDMTTLQYYNAEREISNDNSSQYPSEWDITNNPKYHNGIGLLYVSDVGYATGGNNKNLCMSNSLGLYYQNCSYENNWLIPQNYDSYWTISPLGMNSEYVFAIVPFSDLNINAGFIDVYSIYYVENNVLPVVYLNNNVEIESDSSDNYGSIDNPFRLTV